MSTRKHVVIIGAGVTGLTSAVFLSQTGYSVTVIAAHVPEDRSIEYTSPWAGAHWMTHASADDKRQCDWDVQTYDYWLKMLERKDADPTLPKMGIAQLDAYNLWDEPVKETLWWSPYVRDFRVLSPELKPLATINARYPASTPKLTDGVYYKAMCINTPQYLLYLQQKVRSLGGEVIKAHLPTESGLENAIREAESIAVSHGRPRASIFLNATGLGAKKLCGDEAMFPIRGQTVLVKGEAHCHAVRSGALSAYTIPRPGSGTTILGGTKEHGVWDETPDPEVTKRILERNQALCPELLTGKDGGFEVVSVQCGLRPGRKGGARMEREKVRVDGRDLEIVHAYGHAGGGYQNSVGSARLVVSLVNESLKGSRMAAKL